MKIVFFGQDDFAAIHLQSLLAAKHEVLACVTGPDKPQGRGMKMTGSPVKALALAQGLPCLQPGTLKDRSVVEQLRAYGADLFVVVAYGRLLTQEILDIPRMMCVNVHGSLLPYYRGAAPINWAILNGDKTTGVTLQKMVLKLDAGDVIAQTRMAIGADEDAAALRERMAQEGAKLLVGVLERHPSGNFPLKAQDEHLVSQAPKMTKEMGKIDWVKPAAVIHAQARGLMPWPGAYTFFNGKMLKILRAELTHEKMAPTQAGEVVKVDKDGFYVACLDEILLIKEVQPEAGKVMPASSFGLGHKIAPGFALGR